MRLILVPTDFSQEARNASFHAAELARAFNASLYLFHAYLLPTPVSEVPYVMVTVDDLQKENELHLKKEAEFLRAGYGIRVDSLVRIGIPSDEVRVLCEETGADLIVMGMKGMGGLDKIIGSTTINAVKKVQVPVLIVPHDVPYAVPSVITYASDLSYRMHRELFKPMFNFLQTFKAKLQIVHIRHQHNGSGMDQAEAESILTQAFGNTNYTFEIINHSSVMQGIRSYLDTHPSQLLVMVLHKHSFFERLFSKHHTTEMAYKTNRPLLILQEKA